MSYDPRRNLVSYNETDTNLLGQVSDNSYSGIIYNWQSQMTSYSEQSVSYNSENQAVTENITRSDVSCDVLARLTGYTDTALTEGKTSVTVNEWSAQGFNSSNLVNAQTTVTITEFPGTSQEDQTVTDKQYNIQYNQYGQMVSYGEKIIDSQSPNAVTTNTFSGITYDSLGQIATENENSSSSGNETEELPSLSNLNAQVLSGAQLVSFGNEINWDNLAQDQQNALLSGQTITVTNNGASFSLALTGEGAALLVENSGVSTATVRSNCGFDSQGRLISYTDTILTSGQDSNGNAINKTQVNNRSGIQYNADGKVVSYQETQASSDSPEMVNNISMSDITYDIFGDMSSYVQTTTKQSTLGGGVFSETTTALRSNMIYDSEGNLISYSEADTDSVNPGITTQVTRSSMTYDLKGRLSGYVEQSSDSSGYTTVTNVEDISYDGLGQETSRQEKIVATAVDSSGDIIYSDTQNTDYSNTIYNALGQKIYYVETNADTSNNMGSTIVWGNAAYNQQGLLEKFYQTTTTTDLLNGSSLNVQTDNRTETIYNNSGQIIETDDVTTSSDAPSVTSITKKNNITYNSRGLEDSYVQIKNDTAQDSSGNQIYNVTTTTTRTDTEYNDLGLASSYTEQSESTGNDGTDNLDIITNTQRTNMVYSPAKLLVSYDETSTSSEYPGITTTTTWSCDYNSLGQQTGYTEAQFDGTTLTTIQRNNIQYNSLNQVTSYSETDIKDPSSDIINNGIYEVTSYTTRSGIEYNNSGQLYSYTDTTISSDQPEVETATNRIFTLYNDAGQVSEYNETSIQESIDASGDISVDSNGNPLFYTSKTTDMQNTAFNMFGQVSAYYETVYDNNLNVENDSTRQNLTYNSSGQVTGFDEADTQWAKDGNGNIILNILTTNHRSGTAYSACGQVQDYTEVHISSLSPDLTESITYSSTIDDTGLTTSSDTNDILESSDGSKSYYLDTDTQKQSIMYDSSGRGYSYIETAVSSEDPGITTTTTRENTSYNDYGLVSGYFETSSQASQDGSFDFETTTTRSDISYNSLGLQTNYTDTLTSNQAPLVTTVEEWKNGAYNSIGQLYSYELDTIKTGDDGQGNTLNLSTTDLRQSTSYNVLGQLSAQTDETTSSAQPGVTVTTALSIIVYDGNNLKTSYLSNETQSSDDGSLDLTAETNRLNTEYNSSGQVSGYEEITVSSDSPDVTQTANRSAIAYNDLNQVISYTENDTKAATDSNGNLAFDQSTEINRSGILYDLTGDMVYYTETDNSSTQGTSSITWRADSINGFDTVTRYSETGNDPNDGNYTDSWQGSFNDQNQLIGFTEIRTTDNSGQSEKTRTGITYNSDGQIIGYTETGSSANNPDYTDAFNANFKDAYNSNGQENHYVTTNVSALGVTTQTTRTDTQYNSSGEVSSYDETTNQSVLPGAEEYNTIILSQPLTLPSYDTGETQTGAINQQEINSLLSQGVSTIPNPNGSGYEIVDASGNAYIWDGTNFVDAVQSGYTQNADGSFSDNNGKIYEPVIISQALEVPQYSAGITVNGSASDSLISELLSEGAATISNPDGTGYELTDSSGNPYLWNGSNFVVAANSGYSKNSDGTYSDGAGDTFSIVSFSGPIVIPSYTTGTDQSPEINEQTIGFIMQSAAGMVQNPSGSGYEIVDASGNPFIWTGTNYAAATTDLYTPNPDGTFSDSQGNTYSPVVFSEPINLPAYNFTFSQSRSLGALATESLISKGAAEIPNPYGSGYELTDSSGNAYVWNGSGFVGADAGYNLNADGTYSDVYGNIYSPVILSGEWSVPSNATYTAVSKPDASIENKSLAEILAEGAAAVANPNGNGYELQDGSGNPYIWDGSAFVVPKDLGYKQNTDGTYSG